ncbi:unnamed protein product [Paramecium primaurelia]|uniref:Transmembrane protein n=1 Tax=Paramecium primaurelia TaxID=5886 RepID=A0A8S1LB90_PARPR|nr:unnamed protein product [Paramecium primaurelia]
MKWEYFKQYQGLIIQTNLSPTINNFSYAKFQIAVYFLQLSQFLIDDSKEQVFSLIKSFTKICLICPYFMNNKDINILIGIVITVLNCLPYIIITYRFIMKSHNSVDSISKSVLDLTTIIINNYFLNFTWLFYVSQLYYICWNLLNVSDPFLLLLSIINLLIALGSLLISNIYFINYEFFQQSLRKYFNYINIIAQLLLIPLIFMSIRNQFIFVLVSKIIFGLFICMLIGEAIIEYPFGFSAYAKLYNKGLTTFTIVYLITTIQKAFSINSYSCIVIFLILLPVSQHLTSALIEMKRQTVYQTISKQNQYFELLYIENMFELNGEAQKCKQKEIEYITKFCMHHSHCRQNKCQCKKIGFEKIIKLDQTVIFVSCLFKRSFDKHKSTVQKRIGDFEVLSLKFLTFINKFKRNGPKTYQELKVLFQKQREYSFYFIQMCLFLQFIIQAQMQKDEDYNINSESRSRISNVKLQVSKSERSIVQNLYQMEQVKQNMLPLLIQICQFKSGFWKQIQEGKIATFIEIEKQLQQLQILQQQITKEYNRYCSIFFVNGRTYNVQFLKFDALIQLILYNNARAYYDMEKDCKEILAYERSMSTFEITNINFFKGDAISVKVCIAFGPNIGKVRNKVISPLIPRFFGFADMASFIDYTKGNINPLMPNWLLGVHDEMMQNYIRRGSTQRIGKYFQTFAKLCDQTLIRCQVYLAHNFSPDLEADFSMIGCLKRLEQDEIDPKDESKRLRNLIFKGQQHVLFDIYGNLMGITQGLYKMIDRMQRKLKDNNNNNNNKQDEVKQKSFENDESSEDSDSEVFDVYEIKWSNQPLTIEDFYLKVLIWMLFPFITAEIEQTGIEYLMNGQIPPKGKYPNPIDLESSNTVVSNKETYMFIPEDINLFVQQYNKVLGKINEDEKIQTSNFSLSGKRAQYIESESINAKQQVTVFNEKLCSFFFEEFLRKHQQLVLGNFSRQDMRMSNLNQMTTTIQNSEKVDSSSESEGQLKTRAEQMYYDKFQNYIQRITTQDFNPIPVIYSINYEEFRYKKNEIENKVQMFVIELTVNEQQLASMEKGYRKQLRDTLKQMQAQMKQEKTENLNRGSTNVKQSQNQSQIEVISEDSMSLQGNFSEKVEQDDQISLYKFLSHPSKIEEYCFSDQNILTDQCILTSAKEEQNKLLLTNRKSLQLLEYGIYSAKSNGTENQFEQQSKNNFLKASEKEAASKVVLKLSQKSRQQKFYNELEQKVIQSNQDKEREKVENEDSYLIQLKNFDENYKAINQKINEFQYPNSYKFQNYILFATLLLVIVYILLVSIAVWNQYDYGDCMSLIQILLKFQKTYSLITHGLFRIQYSYDFNITNFDQLHVFYDKQIFQEVDQLINFSNTQKNTINDIDIQLSIFYDIDNSTKLNLSITETIQKSLAQFYKVVENKVTTDYELQIQFIQSSVANLKEIGQLPQLAFDSCYDTKIDKERYYQQLLIIFMVIIFLLVLILQSSQIPMISTLGKYKKKLYMALLDINQLQFAQEQESFDALASTLKKSVYDWMMIDFIVEGKIFDIEPLYLNGFSSDNASTNYIDNQNRTKQEKNKLIKKLKGSNIQQIRYIILLIIDLVVIMSYFLVIFLIIFILTDQLLSGLELLFKYQTLQSSFINVLNNADLVAYKSLSNSSLYYNIISQSEFLNYSQVLQGTEQDFFLQYDNNIIVSLTDENINQKIEFMNQQSICNTQYALDCQSTLVGIYNEQILAYYQQGLKSLFVQVYKIIQQYPQFYQGNQINNSLTDFSNFVETSDHIAYLDYGTDLIITAYSSIVDMAQEQFDIQISKYQQTLIIFILSIGILGLIIKAFLGRMLMRMQKQSIDTCQASLLLLSPRRYTQKSIAKLITQII